jgi:hypothetical protein
MYGKERQEGPAETTTGPGFAFLGLGFGFLDLTKQAVRLDWPWERGYNGPERLFLGDQPLSRGVKEQPASQEYDPLEPLPPSFPAAGPPDCLLWDSECPATISPG